jgi:hypothetical protein
VYRLRTGIRSKESVVRFRLGCHHECLSLSKAIHSALLLVSSPLLLGRNYLHGRLIKSRRHLIQKTSQMWVRIPAEDAFVSLPWRSGVWYWLFPGLKYCWKLIKINKHMLAHASFRYWLGFINIVTLSLISICSALEFGGSSISMGSLVSLPYTRKNDNVVRNSTCLTVTIP